MHGGEIARTAQYCLTDENTNTNANKYTTLNIEYKYKYDYIKIQGDFSTDHPYK